MCGIVGLFLKDTSLEPRLGGLLTDMLVTMTDRGPDSAGIAVYGDAAHGRVKMTVQSDVPDVGFLDLASRISGALATPVTVSVKDTHAVLDLPQNRVEDARNALADLDPSLRVMSFGETIEIYKEVGLPRDVAARFELSAMSGSHGIGHTRIATESAVTTMGAHPFNTGADQCLVHNG